MGRLIDEDDVISVIYKRIDNLQTHEAFKRKHGDIDLLGLVQMIKAIQTAQLERKWIPCSKRLPGEKDSIFAGLYGTPKWSKSMFRKRSQKVLVTVVYPNGESGVDVNHTTDGEWYKDPLSKAWDVKTVAWMPFPEPYKEGE